MNCLPHHRGHCANSEQQLSPPVTVTDPALTCPNPLSSLHTSVSEDEDRFFTPPEAPEPAGTQLSLTPVIMTPASLPVILTPAISTPASISDLPPFVPISTPTFRWGDVDDETFACSINRSYEVIVRNIFKVPSGKAGKLSFKSSRVCSEPMLTALPLKVWL